METNTETKTPSPKVGDILSCGWGWEQTRYDFYQVVGVTPKSVRLRKIAKKCVAGGYNFPTNAQVVPVKDTFTGESFTKRVQSSWDGKGYGVSISSYSYAKLWDGEPETESGDH